jgi:hypothetical protein
VGCGASAKRTSGFRKGLRRPFYTTSSESSIARRVHDRVILWYCSAIAWGLTNGIARNALPEPRAKRPSPSAHIRASRGYNKYWKPVCHAWAKSRGRRCQRRVGNRRDGSLHVVCPSHGSKTPPYSERPISAAGKERIGAVSTVGLTGARGGLGVGAGFFFLPTCHLGSPAAFNSR